VSYRSPDRARCSPALPCRGFLVSFHLLLRGPSSLRAGSLQPHRGRASCEQAQDLLRHAIPSGDLAEVIDRALTVLLKDVARKKCAATDRPRSSRGTAPGSRDIPAKVRRTAWLHDRGACGFVSKSGRRCNERAFGEFHHIDPHGVGGEATAQNIRLRCRAHNAFESELFYGHGRPTERPTLPGKSQPPSRKATKSRDETATQSGVALVSEVGDKVVRWSPRKSLTGDPRAPSNGAAANGAAGHRYGLDAIDEANFLGTESAILAYRISSIRSSAILA
jgi:hypothetical protein